MKIGKIGIVFLFMLAMLSTASASADCRYYLNPTDSSVPGSGDTIDVEIWLDATVPVSSGFLSINYSSCANIISCTPNTDSFEDTGAVLLDGKMNYIFSHWAGWDLTDQPIGLYHLATFTIECCDDASDCNTILKFDNVQLYKSSDAIDVPFTAEDGTFTCGDPGQERTCLGDCLDASGKTISSNVSCYECLVGDGQGVTWINNPCTVSACGCTCDSMEHTECPECCDGVDNDGDGLVDMDDPKCGCCIDGDETNGDDPCPPPCIPELPTLAFMSIGILGMFLLVRKRG